MSRASFLNRKRIIWLFLIYFLLTVIMIARLAYWQLYKSEWLEKKALSQWTLSIPIQPKRGTIYDNHGRPLAINSNADTIAAVPKQVSDVLETARTLAPILNMSVDALSEKLATNKAQIYIKRRVDPEVSAKIQEKNLPGIVIVKESKRYYPNDNLASHVLGFAGIDQGWSGLELQYDQYLQGHNGVMNFGADEEGEQKNAVSYVKPVAGNNLELTLDLVMQSIVELNLEKALVQHNASSVTAIAMDIHTGGILAMANKPDFNPNDYQAYEQALWRNGAISDMFEPGSTFKIITMASVLEENLVSAGDRFYDPGYIIVAGERIGCWKYGGHGSQDYREIIQNSCNPGFVMLGQRLGVHKLYNHIVDFGFTEKTLIDLPGEAKGIMFKEEQMGPVELATTAFGQGPAVTPIQQIRAIAAIANDGVMTTPHLVNRIVDKDDQVIYAFEDTVKRQVISKETSEDMCELLESVVSEGTGNRAFIEGYKIAGKTGTAQVPKEGGGYYSNKYIASFIGFAPADDPQIALFVSIKDPRGPYGYFGGVIAAPLFGNMMFDILRYLEVPTSVDQVTTQDHKQEVPSVIGLPLDTACAQLRAKGFSPQINGGTKGIVTSQTPAPGILLDTGEKIVISVDPAQKPDESVEVVVPDITGLSMREASNRLGLSGLRINILGTGVAIEQDIKAGEKVRRNSVITVKFEPRDR